MTAASLDRLRRAVAAHAGATLRPPAPPIAPPRPPLPELLGGAWHETALGPTFVKDAWYPLSHAHGAYRLDAPLSAVASSLAKLSATGVPSDPQRLAFFDIETTGLSGGAGTRVFLAGLGTYERDGFRLRQYFLADLAHEQAMLSMLTADLARFDGLVTYNGRAFDVPVLESRLTMSRMKPAVHQMTQLDLLHAVRRLYRHRMPGCRLAEAERRLLRVEREADTPGWLVPSLYVDYVRAQRVAPLRGVFQHNAEDVLSLTGVLATLAEVLEGAARVPEDAVAVARWLERDGEHERAASLYRQALPWLEGEADWSWAAARYAALCRRLGLRGEAHSLWERLWDAGDPNAGVELSKHLEHHERDYTSAVRIVEQLVRDASDDRRGALELRLARLRAKLARGG